jgi:hypothetical protein
LVEPEASPLRPKAEVDREYQKGVTAVTAAVKSSRASFQFSSMQQKAEEKKASSFQSRQEVRVS